MVRLFSRSIRSGRPGSRALLPSTLRVEAHRRAGRNIQPHAEGGGSVELHGLVDLEEMEVRSDLDRPGRRCGGPSMQRAAARIEINAAVDGSDAARMFGIGLRSGAGRIGSWTVTSLVPIGKHAFHLNDVHHRGDAGQHVSVERIVDPYPISSATERPPGTFRISSVMMATLRGSSISVPLARRARAQFPR